MGQHMWSNFKEYLFAERPYGVKLIMAFSAIAIVIMLNTNGGQNSPVARDMARVAHPNIWDAVFISYAAILIYGVFGHNATARMLGSIIGMFMWFGLFLFHTLVGSVGPLRGVYFVFGVFSIWNILAVYEYIRIQRRYGIDLTKMAHDMMMQFLKNYRK
jgi:hypothetical protein